MFCKNCGAKIKDGAQFCPKCGAKAREKVILPNNTKKKNINIDRVLKNFNIEQLLGSVTKRRLIYAGAAALAAVLVIFLITGIKKRSDTDVAYSGHEDARQQDMGQESAGSYNVEQKNMEQGNMERNIRELTLSEQLSLMKEYMDTGDISEEELLNVMVEQHLYEPDLYLGLAEIMIAGNHSDSAIDVLVTGYQYTSDEQIKSKLLDLQTRAKVGDDNADKIDRALGIAEDIANDLGYGETVEKGKNILDTLYGVYLDSK